MTTHPCCLSFRVNPSEGNSNIAARLQFFFGISFNSIEIFSSRPDGIITIGGFVNTFSRSDLDVDVDVDVGVDFAADVDVDVLVVLTVFVEVLVGVGNKSSCLIINPSLTTVLIRSFCLIPRGFLARKYNSPVNVSNKT